MNTLACSIAVAVFPAAALAQPFAITASSIPCGGRTTPATAGVFTLACTIGDPIASATRTAGAYAVGSGFLAVTGMGGGPAPCYANCDGSTASPSLNVNDFLCFLNRFAAGDPLANCDGSVTPPTLNVNDFLCFVNAYAAGCP